MNLVIMTVIALYINYPMMVEFHDECLLPLSVLSLPHLLTMENKKNKRSIVGQGNVMFLC
jgi:hypothetical protein